MATVVQQKNVDVLKLEEFVKKGKLDKELIVNSLEEIQEPKEKLFNEKTFALAKGKILRLLDDFENFYGPKGRALTVTVHIGKENNADRAIEEFHYDDKTFIAHVIDIGTKGKYEPVETIEE